MLTALEIKRSLRSWSGSGGASIGPAWLQWVWTFVFCAVVSVGFTIIGFALYANGDGAWRNSAGWAQWYGRNLVVACSIGYANHAAFVLGRRWLGAARVKRFGPWQRMAFYGGVPVASLLVAWPLGLALAGADLPGLLAANNANGIAAAALLAALVVFLSYQYFGLRWRRFDAERRATEAQLKLLQGQIEPHFLFNTLANVLGLMDADPPRARLMLESFVDYLRSSLGGLRTAGHTLGHELTLVEAYASGLPVIASRIGALAELVEHGETGLLFEPGDAHGLADALQWACCNPAAMLAMGACARARYEARYTPDINYAQTLAIYRSAIDEAKAAA